MSHPQVSPAERAAVLERHLHDHGHVDPQRLARALDEDGSGGGPSPALGARVVARAWTDEDFRARLLSDAMGTLREYIGDQMIPLVVLEDTPEVHHVIVCTLCSCYPGNLLGNPPEWYKSFEYRSRVVREPRVVLAEFGFDVLDGIEIKVVDSSAELRYMVLPMRPAGTEGWSPEQLAALVTRNSMLGTGGVLQP